MLKNLDTFRFTKLTNILSISVWKSIIRVYVTVNHFNSIHLLRKLRIIAYTYGIKVKIELSYSIFISRYTSSNINMSDIAAQGKKS